MNTQQSAQRIGKNVGKRYSLAVLTCILWVLCLGFTGCGGKQGLQDKEIKFAVVGSKAQIVENEPELLIGMDMAAEDLNRRYEERGYRFSIEFCEEQGEAGKVKKLAGELAGRDDIDFIISAGSPDDPAKMAAALKKAGKLLLCVNPVDDSMNQKGKRPYVLRSVYTARAQGETLADYADEQGTQRVKVYVGDDLFQQQEAEAFAARAKEHGILEGEPVTLAGMSAEEAAKEFLASAGDGAAIYADRGILFEMVEQIRQKNPAVRIFTDFKADDSEELTTYQKAMEGAAISCYIKTEWEADGLNDLIRRYLQIYKDDRQIGRMTHGYYAITALAEEAVAGKTAEAETVSARLCSGQSAYYHFDAQGCLVHGEIPILVVRNGVFEMEDALEEENTDDGTSDSPAEDTGEAGNEQERQAVSDKEYVENELEL